MDKALAGIIGAGIAVGVASYIGMSCHDSKPAAKPTPQTKKVASAPAQETTEQKVNYLISEINKRGKVLTGNNCRGLMLKRDNAEKYAIKVGTEIFIHDDCACAKYAGSGTPKGTFELHAVFEGRNFKDFPTNSYGTLDEVFSEQGNLPIGEGLRDSYAKALGDTVRRVRNDQIATSRN